MPPADAVPLAEHLALAAEARRTLASLRAWRESAGGPTRERDMLHRSLRDRERRLQKLADHALLLERQRSLTDHLAETELLPAE